MVVHDIRFAREISLNHFLSLANGNTDSYSYTWEWRRPTIVCGKLCSQSRDVIPYASSQHHNANSTVIFCHDEVVVFMVLADVDSESQLWLWVSSRPSKRMYSKRLASPNFLWVSECLGGWVDESFCGCGCLCWCVWLSERVCVYSRVHWVAWR